MFSGTSDFNYLKETPERSASFYWKTVPSNWDKIA